MLSEGCSSKGCAAPPPLHAKKTVTPDTITHRNTARKIIHFFFRENLFISSRLQSPRGDRCHEFLLQFHYIDLRTECQTNIIKKHDKLLHRKKSAPAYAPQAQKKTDIRRCPPQIPKAGSPYSFFAPSATTGASSLSKGRNSASTSLFCGFFVKSETSGTMTNPASIVHVPV